MNNQVLADANLKKCLDGQVQVEILVGSDYYFNLINDKPNEIIDNLRLLDSKLDKIAVGRYDSEVKNIGQNLFTVLRTSNNINTVHNNLFLQIDSVKEGEDLLDLCIAYSLKSIGAAESTTDVANEDFLSSFNEKIKYIPSYCQYSVPFLKNSSNSLKVAVDKKPVIRAKLNDLCIKESFIEKMPLGEFSQNVDCHYFTTKAAMLGLENNLFTDCLLIKKPTYVVKGDTMRAVVANTAAVWEPQGMLTPIQIRAKLLINLMWQAKLEWEGVLICDMVKEWEIIVNM